MQLNLNKSQGFIMPEQFYRLLNSELATITPPANTDAITLNFRDRVTLRIVGVTTQ